MGYEKLNDLFPAQNAAETTEADKIRDNSCSINEATYNALGCVRYDVALNEVDICKDTGKNGEEKSQDSLQDAFLKFKRRRQEKYLERKHMNSDVIQRSREEVSALRTKFVEQAKTYLGVPYAKRYHEPDTPEFNSSLFLDCCGLVRKVLRDLKSEFGFTIGPWNQAYMYDTLPTIIDNVDQMKPGDLVFVSAQFYDAKMKKQRHDMVHVEIWAGGGHKTIGARWKKGRLQIHDSYQYVSKSYHSMVYHFKSIDTWLLGICKSFCPEHEWRMPNADFTPGQRSIFAIVEDEHAEDESSLNEFEGSQSLGHSEPPPNAEDIVSSPNDREQNNSKRGQAISSSKGGNKRTPSLGQSNGTDDGNSGGDDHTDGYRKPTRLSPSNTISTKTNKKTPTFFIGGHNGAKMVEATLTSLGWKRIDDSNDRTFFLKWVECKKNLDFANFREGEQIVNHISNVNLLTTKIGLLTSLEEFERVCSRVGSPTKSKSFLLKDFFPETYKLQNKTEVDHFVRNIYQDGEVWICKPTGSNQGKGIFLLRDRTELEKRFAVKQESRPCHTPFPGRIVQRYIENPLLLKGFKADIRTYMLIAGTCPYMVFYHTGYVRLSVVPYSLNHQEMHAHLTNQYIQKKHPMYQEVKDETVWSLEQLQDYLNTTYSKTGVLTQDWVFTTFTKRMQEIMLKCFESVRHRLDRKLGFFDLLGFDFMLDEDFKVWLIEINVNPALHTNCKILSDLIPQLVDNTLKLVIEIFVKSKNKERLVNLENIGRYQLLYNGDKR